MTYAEDELLPLSGVQHLVFCERQAALVHVERIWADNALTVDGSHRHRRVHESGPRRERRGDLIVVRGLPLRSLRLGLVGVADVVEFHRTDPGGAGYRGGGGTKLPGVEGVWIPFPVEYKRGRPKSHRADEAQVAAQAMCLEEMLGVTIGEGALFYGQEQRRITVLVDPALRQVVEKAARRIHELVRAGRTPPPVPSEKCEMCSLKPLCLPTVTRKISVRAYLEGAMDVVRDGPGEDE